MPITFQKELQKIARLVDDIIRKDDYPQEILPDYLREAVIDYPLRGGKRLRPALLLWSCGLLGKNPECAKYAAVAVELYHNWTLVHDDIIDNDSLRRGKPTTHIQLAKYSSDSDCSGKFGRDLAMLTGDIQQAWAANTLLKSVELGVSAELTLFLSRRLHELVTCELISGEALDVEFSLTNWNKLSSEKIERMLSLKTGALLRYCVETGALIALGSAEYAHDESVVKLGQFADAIGIVFQLRDDWLGIFGNEKTLGKSICADMSEAKPTLLLLSTWKNLEKPEQKEFLSYIGKNKYSSAEIRRIRDIIRNSGAEKIVLNRTEKLADKAKKILSAFPNNKYRQLLIECTDYLAGRDR